MLSFLNLNEAEMKLLTAAFGVVGVVVGILLGAGVQSATNAINRKREYRAVNMFGYELIINIRHMLFEFREFDRLRHHILFGVVPSQVLVDELIYYSKWVRRVDPSIAINVMWLKQGMHNLTVAMKSMNKDFIEREESQLSPISEKSSSVLTVTSEAIGAMRYCDYLLWHFFWHGGWAIRIKILRLGIFFELKTVYKNKQNCPSVTISD